MSYTSTYRKNYINKGEFCNMSIVVDGIIGAGKTTVAKMVSEHLNIPMFEELKNDDLENTIEHRMLDRFYADQSRWSAIIQVMFLNERFRDLKTIEKSNQFAILDRSIYGDEIFAKTINKRGNMTDDELTIYQELLHNMLEHINPPKLLIYLDVSIDTAMERIRKRHRGTEADMIPEDYMVDLRETYEEWYNEFNLCPKIRIDLNESAVDEQGELIPRVQEKILKAVVQAYEKSNQMVS
ncbi:MAG: deoxynucleoside kinase [Clostridiales bacterium]|nr:deoxynucleoside kinase [Clostridiales bacterium]